MVYLFGIMDRNLELSSDISVKDIHALTKLHLDQVFQLVLIAFVVIIQFFNLRKITFLQKLRQSFLEIQIVGVILSLLVYGRMDVALLGYKDSDIGYLFDGVVLPIPVLPLTYAVIVFFSWLLIFFATAYIVLIAKDLIINHKNKEKARFNSFSMPIIRKIQEILYKQSEKHIQIDADFKNRVKSIVLFHAVIVSILCLFFIFGIVFVAVYAVICYYLVLATLNKTIENYNIITNITSEIEQGNFEVEAPEELMFFNSLKNDLMKIKVGFKKAVLEEVSSQKMKTELITNVSHDLKTPLTAMVTYIDLLKNTEDEKLRQEYIEVLEKKSSKLTVLIEDLLELSKITTGNSDLFLENVDIVELLDQTLFDLEEEITRKGIKIKKNSVSDKIFLKVDSQKMHRVFDNIIVNITKYAMENTRAYISIIEEDKNVIIEFKNISSMEMNFDEKMILERFVRGDTARNSEGSGLGLAISKSFVELHEGKFKLSIDGDLFKIIIKLNK